jgi:hypothetical protein
MIYILSCTHEIKHIGWTSSVHLYALFISKLPVTIVSECGGRGRSMETNPAPEETGRLLAPVTVPLGNILWYLIDSRLAGSPSSQEMNGNTGSIFRPCLCL